MLDDKKEPAVGGIVQVYMDGILKGKATIDYDGYCSITSLTPGCYSLSAAYFDYGTFTSGT